MCTWARLLSCVQFFGPMWTVACWAPLSMGFFRQECWSGLIFPSLGDLPDPGVEIESLALTGRTDKFSWRSQLQSLFHVIRIFSKENKFNISQNKGKWQHK